MNQDWQPLVDALRSELEEYGALLGLFDTQQNAILSRDSESILLTVSTIEEQMHRLQGLRRQREEIVCGYASQFAQPVNSTLRSLVRFFAAEARPLLEALIDEINHLIHRVRKIRLLGAAALSMTWVADGRMDAYKEYGVRLWDIAAGGLIVECAGGEFWHRCVGDDHTYEICVSNGVMRKQIDREVGRASSPGKKTKR